METYAHPAVQCASIVRPYTADEKVQKRVGPTHSRNAAGSSRLTFLHKFDGFEEFDHFELKRSGRFRPRPAVPAVVPKRVNGIARGRV